MDVTQQNYYEDTGHMSVSAFKKFMKCEVDGLKGFTGESSIPMLVGSYVDSYVEGTLEQFKEEHPEIIAKTGKTKGELKSDFKQADEICSYIDNNNLIQQFLSGDKQTIMTGVIGGVPFKSKMDSYLKGTLIADLKIMRTVTDSNGNFYDFVTKWGYDIQLACYQEIVYQNTGERLPCYIVAITKESPINSVIIKIPQNILDRALYLVESNIERIWEVKQGKTEAVGCGICSSCIEARTETPIISLDTIMEGVI